MPAPYRSPRPVLALIIFAVLAFPAPRADAGLIFDNSDAPVVAINSSGLATTITVSNTVTIGDIAVKTVGVNSSTAFKFVIFDSANTSSPVYLSGSKTFATASDAGFRMSDDFSYTLLAGHTYDIGAVTSSTIQFAGDQIPESQNGLSSSSRAYGVYNYPDASFGNVYSYEGEIQLYSAATVPEPSSLALCGVAGVVGLGYRRIRRKWASIS